MTRIKKTSKRLIAVSLTLCIIPGMLPSIALHVKAAGISLAYDGDSGVYTISSAAEYSNFSADVKSGINYGKKTIILTKGIDLGGISVFPDNQNENYSFKIDKYTTAIQDAISNLVEADADKSVLSDE